MNNTHTKDLIEAIKSGDSQRMQGVFSELTQAKVNAAIDARRLEVASAMFESVEEIDAAASTGDHPNKIKQVASTGNRGEVVVTTNDGSTHTILAKNTDGVMPKIGDSISKYVQE